MGIEELIDKDKPFRYGNKYFTIILSFELLDEAKQAKEDLEKYFSSIKRIKGKILLECDENGRIL